MGIHLEDFFTSYSGSSHKEPPLRSLIKGNFEYLRVSEDKKWVLLRHEPTREERWVYVTHVRVKDLRIAYYDADPTFLPQSER